MHMWRRTRDCLRSSSRLRMLGAFPLRGEHRLVAVNSMPSFSAIILRASEVGEQSATFASASSRPKMLGSNLRPSCLVLRRFSDLLIGSLLQFFAGPLRVATHLAQSKSDLDFAKNKIRGRRSLARASLRLAPPKPFAWRPNGKRTCKPQISELSTKILIARVWKAWVGLVTLNSEAVGFWRRLRSKFILMRELK